MVDEIQLEEAKKEEKTKSEKLLRIFCIIIGVFSLIILGIVKYQVPEFKLIYVVLLGAVVAIICTAGFYSFELMYKLKELKEHKKEISKQPKPASLDELRRIAKSALTNEHYMNHLKGCIKEQFVHFGKAVKSRIYVYVAPALYNDEMKKGIVYILINTHYPNELRDVLIDPSFSEVMNALKSLASDPEDEPDKEIIERNFPLLGSSEKITKTKKKEALKLKKETPKELE